MGGNTVINSLEFWIGSRKFSRNMLASWNKKKEKKYASESLANLAEATRNLADEIRRVEKHLGRPHRYLPQSGFYQGRIL
jgi:hypothetical protein